jgi:ribosomal protein L32
MVRLRKMKNELEITMLYDICPICGSYTIAHDICPNCGYDTDLKNGEADEE